MAKVFKLIDLQAPWTDSARAKLLEALNGSGARKAQGWGYPMMMDAYAPIQFVITSEEVLITNSYHEVRQVYTDGRSHPKEEDRWATTWGDSVGHWEGDTLVIDTIAVRDPTRYFIFAPPLSEAAHYVERLRKMGADRIEAEFTIEDTVTLTRPWTVKTAYVRAPNLDRLVPDAFENDRSEVEGDAFGIRPPKD
jgi:hypothetical protein